MKSRRASLGLSGAEFAERAGISASYVSLIESGAKVPDEGVAARLARALGDDEDLYRGWARAARLGLDTLGLLNHLEAIAQTPAYMSLVESGQALPRLDSEAAHRRQQDAAESLRARLREVAAKLTPPVPGHLPLPSTPDTEDSTSEAAVCQVPLLREGADPARLDSGSSSAVIRDHLSIDRRLVGGDHEGRLFAYEVTAEHLAHLRGVAAPGDLVVLAGGAPAGSGRICAVRTPRGIVLSRVLRKDKALLLLPGEGETEFETLGLENAKARAEAIVGAHVLLIRR